MSVVHCFFGVGLLFEYLLDAVQYFRTALDDACNLFKRVRGGGNSHVYHLYAAVSADN